MYGVGFASTHKTTTTSAIIIITANDDDDDDGHEPLALSLLLRAAHRIQHGEHSAALLDLYHFYCFFKPPTHYQHNATSLWPMGVGSSSLLLH